MTYNVFSGTLNLTQPSTSHVTLVAYVCVRTVHSKKSSGTAAGDTKSFSGAVVTSDSDDAICDITDDVSEFQAEALPLVGERPMREPSAVEHRPIAVCDLRSYVTERKLSTFNSLKDEYDVQFLFIYFIC